MQKLMEKLIDLKPLLPILSPEAGAVGVAGGFMVTLFGGWDAAVLTLIIFMAIDYISGLILAGVFKKSAKSENGGLNSYAGWKGLCKKGMTLAIILIAHRLDVMLHTKFIMDAVVIGYIANEAISIIENAGLMGLPVPEALTKAIAVLKQKAEQQEDKTEDGQ